MIFAISMGIRTSISTSRITKIGASTDCFLYSRTDLKSVLFIFLVYLLILPVFFCKIVKHPAHHISADSQFLFGDSSDKPGFRFPDMLHDAVSYPFRFLCAHQSFISCFFFGIYSLYETVFLHQFQDARHRGFTYLELRLDILLLNVPMEGGKKNILQNMSLDRRQLLRSAYVGTGALHLIGKSMDQKTHVHVSDLFIIILHHLHLF